MLGKNLISSVLTQIPLFIFGIAVGVFSTRILGEEGKGIVALFQSKSQFFYLFFRSEYKQVLCTSFQVKKLLKRQ
jgi:O-antigen/teichoic acid export membrane protein